MSMATSGITCARNRSRRRVNGSRPRTAMMWHGAPSFGTSRPPTAADPKPRPPDVSDRERERFITELGSFSAAGVERAAWGWDQHAGGDVDSFHRAERAALHAIEKADLA